MFQGLVGRLLPLRGAVLRTATVWLACLSIFSMTGVVFGLPSLYPSLYGLGFWARLCGAEAAVCQAHSRSISSTVDEDGKCCEAQLLRVGLTSSITFFMADAAAGPWGEYVDRVGPRQCFATASFASACGFTLLGFLLLPGSSLSLGRDVATTAAFAILGLVGPGIFNGGYVGCLAIVGESPAHVSAFTAYSAACFDGSALVLALLHLLGVRFGVGLVFAMISWAAVILVLRFLFLHCLDEHRAELLVVRGKDGVPASAQPLPPATESSLLLGPSTGTVGASAQLTDPTAATHTATTTTTLPTDEEGSEHMPSLRSTLLHRANLAVVGLMVSLNLINAFYLQTQADQMGLLFSPSTAANLSTFLEFGFPILGFLASIAAVTHVFERNHDRELLCWAWPAGLGIAFCLVQMIPYVAAQYVAAMLFGPMRTLQWACYFHALAVAPRYPQHLAGRVLGYNNVVIALLSDTLPYALSAVVASGDSEPSASVEALRYALVRVALLVPMLASSGALAFTL